MSYSSTVQANILDPLTQVAIDPSQSGVTQPNNPILLIGQVTTTQPFALTPGFSVAAVRSFAGRGSHLARMYEALVANYPIAQVFLLPYADAGGATKATGTIVISGPATAPGTLFVYIAGYLVAVGVNSGDTATIMAGNLQAAIAATPDLAVTATVSTGTITVTAKNGGTLGNAIDLRMNYLGAPQQTVPAGVSVTITAMSGGATDPDLTQVAAVLGDTFVRTLAHPYGGSPTGYATPMAAFATLMNFSSGRWSPLRKSWGHVWTARAGLPSALSTFGATNNDPHSTVVAYEIGSPSPPWEVAAAVVGAAAASLLNQPNQPLQTLQVQFMAPPPLTLSEANGGRFQKSTRNTLLGVGLGTLRYNAGNQPLINRLPTTYQINAYGQADQTSYFDTEQLYLLMRISDLMESMITTTFPRVLLADTGTRAGPGVPLVTPADYIAALIDQYQQMITLGLVEDMTAFIAALQVYRDTINSGQLDVLYPPFLVQGLRQIGTTVQFRNYSAAAAAAAVAAAG